MGPLFFLILVSTSHALTITSEWQKILRYEKGLLGNYQSSITNSDFFVSPSGKTDPKKELETSLELLKKSDETFICRFPFRSHYLNKTYNLKIAFNYSRCPELNDFLRRTDPVAISLIFASYGSDGPASLFGHTLFRIHKRGNQNDLLDYGVNYAAEVDTNNAFVYGMKGLLGGFDGRFSLLPYFYKLHEYHNMDARDVWSFRLKLTEEEALLTTLHLFELDRARFTYYYLTKNCAYALLEVLDTINPTWRLTERLGYFVIPIDTLFALSDAGLVVRESLRPSPSLILLDMISKLTEKDRQLFYSLKNRIGSNDQLSLEEPSAKLLEALIQYLDLRYNKLAINQNPTKEEKFAHKNREELLIKRSGLQDEGFTTTEFSRSSPLSSQRARKISLGYRDDHDPALTFGYRFSLHELTDLTEGAPEHMGLVMGRFFFDYYSSKKSLQIREATIAEVLNLSPITALTTPLSWNMSIGLINSPTKKDDPTPHFQGGAGYTLGNQLATISLMPHLDLYYNHFTEPTLAAGPLLILNFNLNQKIKAYTSFLSLYELNYQKSRIDTIKFNISGHFTKIMALSFQAERVEENDNLALLFNYYY